MFKVPLKPLPASSRLLTTAATKKSGAQWPRNVTGNCTIDSPRAITRHNRPRGTKGRFPRHSDGSWGIWATDLLSLRLSSLLFATLPYHKRPRSISARGARAGRSGSRLGVRCVRVRGTMAYKALEPILWQPARRAYLVIFGMSNLGVWGRGK